MPGTDTTCILDVGSHSFIRHQSYVVYELARIETIADLRAAEASGNITAMGQLAPETLDRICAGLEGSPNTAEAIKVFYRVAERLRLNP